VIYVIIDTGTLISLALGSRESARAVELASENPYRLALSHDLLYEYKGILKRKKFNFTKDKQNELLNFFSENSDYFEINSSLKFSRDPGDTRIVALADTCKAGYCITGDKQLLKAGRPPSCKFVTPKEFIKLFEN
jgi:putative PIN family toxin of toxin-antitoxin system